jgi:ADP-heptose:LPS heptosyltransferase
MKNIILIILSSIRYNLNFLFKKNNKTNILIIQLSGIGDSILSISFIENYKNLYPNNSINIIITETSMDIFYLNKNISNIYLFKNDKIYSTTSNKSYYIHDFLHSFSFSSIISFRLNLEILKNILFYSAIYYPNPLFEKLRLKSRLFSFFSKNYKKNYYSKFHVANLHSNLISNIKLKNLTEITIVDQIPTDLLNYLNKNNNKFALFHFSGADPIRKLNLDKIQQILNKSKDNIILLGNKSDNYYIRDIIINNHFNATGILNFNQIAFLLKKCKYIISVDSSIMHLASTIPNIKLIAIMGNSLVDYYGPYNYKNNNNITILHRNPICSPCSNTFCNKFNGFSCVQDIESHEILNSTQLYND